LSGGGSGTSTVGMGLAAVGSSWLSTKDRGSLDRGGIAVGSGAEVHDQLALVVESTKVPELGSTNHSAPEHIERLIKVDAERILRC